MKYANLSLKYKILISLVLVIAVVMFGQTLITSKVTHNALTGNLSSSLQVMARVAADAVRTGLEFVDRGAVESAVQPFMKQSLFSYIRVTNKQGEEVVVYRKQGLRPITTTDKDHLQSFDDEMFSSLPVKSGSATLGEITIGISLTERDRALSSARLLNILAALVLLGILGVSILAITHKITAPIQAITGISRKLAKGRVDLEIDIHRQDEIGELADSFRKIILSQKEQAELANQIAAGNLDTEFQPRSDGDVLGHALVTVKSSLREMQSELTSTIEGQKGGDLDARCDTDRLKGAYAALLRGINDTLDAVIKPVQEAIGIMQDYAKGDLSRQMRALPGKQITLTNGLEGIHRNLHALIAEGKTLAKAAEEGQLHVRGNAEQFAGSYREIIQGINSTIENIVKPLNEAVNCLSRIAEGDLTRAVQGDYQGDYAVMKKALDETLDAMNKLLGRVSKTVDEVANGAQQVSSASQSLSDGATRQASSLEQMTASMNEIGSQTRQNAENAQEANQLSSATRDNAEEGNKQMKRMLSAMNEIKKSSDDIHKIIKAIDEIAFQTNLLALNAAVEAARAGVHGKGFAVVAEEVRNLAQRSAKAAQETSELIEDSVMKVENGTRIANLTAKSLKKIVQDVNQVSALVGEIAHASSEQAQGIEQVNSGLVQIDEVTQSNTAGAEESAAASQTLLTQARSVKSILDKFQLREDAGDFDAQPVDYGDAETVNVIQDFYAADDSDGDAMDGFSDFESKADCSNDFIALDDDEFGDF